MSHLMIGKENINEYFYKMHTEGSDITSVYISTDKVGSQDDHEDYCWEEVVGFGVGSVITTPYMYQFGLTKFEDVTMALVEYEEIEGEDSWIECLITPNGTESIKVFG